MITAQSSLFEVLMCHLPNSRLSIAGDFNQLCLPSTHAACLIMILALWLCSHSIFWSHPHDMGLYNVYPMAWLLAVRLYLFWTPASRFYLYGGLCFSLILMVISVLKQ